MTVELDSFYMARALELAARGLFTTDPNPRVGCVLVREGRIVGEGWHERAGDAHAEIHALKQAGSDAAGSTAYVSLEPCAHYGRTPPCTEALIQAGVRRVVAATDDPNPEVNGKGLEQLRSAGLVADCGCMREEAQGLNPGFFSRMRRGLPWLRMKLAASLDGKTALVNRSSQWITALDARRDGHAFRARASAVLTGIGTVKDDDPRMDVRLVETPRQPRRILVDSRLEVNPAARILAKPGVLVVTAIDPPDERRSRIEDLGHQILCLPNAHGKVDLPALMRWLGTQEINEVHVEAGNRLNGSLLREGCVDELLVYLAPRLLGPGIGMIDLPGMDRLPEQPELVFDEVTQLGPDLRIRARVLHTRSEAVVGGSPSANGLLRQAQLAGDGSKG